MSRFSVTCVTGRIGGSEFALTQHLNADLAKTARMEPGEGTFQAAWWAGRTFLGNRDVVGAFITRKAHPR